MEGVEKSEYNDIQTVEGKDQIKFQKDNESQYYAKCYDEDSDDPEDSEIMFLKDTGPAILYMFTIRYCFRKAVPRRSSLC